MALRVRSGISLVARHKMRAVLSLIIFLFGSHGCSAQTALETIAFLALDIDSASRDSSVDITSSEQILVYKRFGAEVTITQPKNCFFRIAGQTLLDGRAVNIEHTLDFTQVAPGDPGTFKKDPNVAFAPVVYYMRVRGVRVCSLKNGKAGSKLDNFLVEGECQDQMTTAYVLPGGNLDRQISALKHLRQNFCKGRAF